LAARSVSERQQSQIFFLPRPLSASLSARARKALRIVGACRRRLTDRLGGGRHCIWGQIGEEARESAASPLAATPGRRGGGAGARAAPGLRRRSGRKFWAPGIVRDPPCHAPATRLLPDIGLLSPLDNRRQRCRARALDQDRTADWLGRGKRERDLHPARRP